jgi:hypothetical protein
MGMNNCGTRRRLVMTALLAVGALGLGSFAWARGEGIKAGSGRLHFGADLELSFDSNPGYFPSGAANSAFDLMLRARPLFSLDFPSEVVSFQLNGKVGYDYYFGLDNKRTSDLSTVSGDADLKLGINPNGQFSFFLIDTFSRSGDPRYTSLAGRFDRTDNEVKAQFQIKPGGGALMFDLAYAFYLDWFDNTFDTARAVSNYAHRAFFSGKWKFLPKTALALDFDADIRRYFGEYSDGTRNPDVNGIRATLGLIGQISPSISIVVKVGYGDSLISSSTYTGSDYRSVVGQAEMTYQAATTMFQLGYSRNFQPVVLFGYFGQDRFYLRFRQQLAGRFTLSADASLDLLDYGQAAAAGVEARFDYFVSGGAAFEYHLLDWLSLALDYRFQALFSSFQQPLAGSGGVDYNQHMVTFRLGLDY